MMNIQDIFTVTHFYHLEFSREKIDINALINITYRLSELDSLKIHSLSISTAKYSSMEKTFRRFISNKNKITKVCLENMFEIEEVYFLIKLCPRMNYLQINCINTMDVEVFVRDVISKINNDCNQNLRSLRFSLPTADNQTIEQLVEMIDSQKLLLRYKIKCELDNIYLQWENDCLSSSFLKL